MTKTYEIITTRQAEQFLKSLKKNKPLKKKFEEAIYDEIALDPYGVGEAKTGNLKGIYGYDLFYSGTNYEIAYSIETNAKGDTVVVILAGTRENFYNDLASYWKIIKKNNNMGPKRPKK